VRLRVALLVVVVAALGLSAWEPYERGTWWLEVAPVVLALPLLVATHRRFPLTSLVCVLIAVHAVILCIGGHWTYARVPLGDWARDAFGFERNHYDRIGHVAQGFVPAMIAREILLRTSPLRPGAWLFFLVTCVALAISALYELIEWWAALIGGSEADSFLGAQGDVWDSHWDMLFALLGALAAQLLLSRRHDRELRELAAQRR
jgi:putative membrane protein